jgi:hypothetical protein
MYHVHQFSKVEMFIFCRPEDSDTYHEEHTTIEEVHIWISNNMYLIWAFFNNSGEQMGWQIITIVGSPGEKINK